MGTVVVVVAIAEVVDVVVTVAACEPQAASARELINTGPTKNARFIATPWFAVWPQCNCALRAGQFS
jgi:hypothetical protein